MDDVCKVCGKEGHATGACTELPPGVQGRLVAIQYERCGYREYTIPEGTSLEERVQEILSESDGGDVLVTSDKKIMVKSVERKSISVEGTKGAKMVGKVQDPRDQETFSKYTDEGFKIFKIEGEGTSEEKRDMLDDEIVTSSVQEVIFFSDGRVGFKYAN